MNGRICLGDVIRVLGCPDFAAADKQRAIRFLGFESQKAAADIPAPPDTAVDDVSPPQTRDRDVSPRFEDPPPSDDRANEAWIDELIKPVRAGKPGWYRHVRALPADDQPDDLPLPRAAPLFPPESQRALLISMLTKPAPAREIDVPRLVDRVASLEVFKKLPMRRRLSSGGSVQVLVDISDRMEPFAQDQSQLIEVLRRLIPEDRLQVLHCDGAPPDDARTAARASQAYRYPSRGTLVLLVSDIGQGGGLFSPRLSRPERWVGFARRLAVQGCAFLVLAPLSPDRIARPLGRRLKIIPWDRRFSGAAVRTHRQRQRYS